MGLWHQKAWFLWNTPRFWQVFKLWIFIQCRPKIFALFKNPKIFDKQNRAWVLPSKTWSLWINPRFWQMLKLGFGCDVGQISLYSLCTRQRASWTYSPQVFTSVHLFNKIVRSGFTINSPLFQTIGSRFTTAKTNLGEDSPSWFAFSRSRSTFKQRK